jgi:uncharacterized protein with PIN domain
MIIADSMLGKLSKYLRMIGYEVEYVSSDKDDSYIISEAKSNLVITRDKALHRMIPDSVLVTSYEPLEQLKEVIPYLHEPENQFLSICTICGSKLEKVWDKKNLPEYVNKDAEEVFHCQKCDRYYWNGTHVQKFKKMMESIGIEIQDRK